MIRSSSLTLKFATLTKLNTLVKPVHIVEMWIREIEMVYFLNVQHVATKPMLT